MVAVVAADIAGYSRLMGADEEGTLTRLKACRRDLIDPGIARHRGRIVKTTGDGFLIEFSSPVEAVRWAVAMQQGIVDRDTDIPEDKRLRFRIGINLGDVIIDDKDLYGDAVNIAARLENLADPGGICISRTVREQIRDRLALPFEDAGEQSVRNIARPIRVYALAAAAITALPKIEVPEAPRPAARHNARRYITAVALAGVLIVAGGGWWLWPLSKPPPTAVTASAPAAAPALPATAPRLSIVVLPFANLSDDRDQQYFADGVTEDLTTDLSNIAGMLVISRNTAFTYKGKSVDAKQVGRELGVRYVLEGSVRRSANQVRVSAQLIDAETNVHLWAERFDRDTSDLFALQNEITGRIAVALNFALVGSEAARPTANPDALDYMFRGRAVLSKPPSRDSRGEAISLFEQALALDPQSAQAKLRLVNAITGRVLDDMSTTRAADIARSEDLVSQALVAEPNSPLAHLAKAQVLRAQRQYADAIPEYETVIALDRNSPGAYANLGQCKLFTGLLEEVIPLVEQAVRLSPRDPDLGYWWGMVGEVHLLQSRTDESILWLEKARSANPAHTYPHIFLASAYGLKDANERAAAELAEARRLRGEGSFRSIARIRAARNFMAPKVRALSEATFFAGLRKAGVPEE